MWKRCKSNLLQSPTFLQNIYLPDIFRLCDTFWPYIFRSYIFHDILTPSHFLKIIVDTYTPFHDVLIASSAPGGEEKRAEGGRQAFTPDAPPASCRMNWEQRDEWDKGALVGGGENTYFKKGWQLPSEGGSSSRRSWKYAKHTMGRPPNSLLFIASCQCNGGWVMRHTVRSWSPYI